MTTICEEDLLLDSYDYHLPANLIADRPMSDRHSSRLLVYDAKTDTIIDDYFYNLTKYLPQNSLLAMNESKVFPCRLLGKRPTGGKVEIFLLSAAPNSVGRFSCLIKSSRKKKEGETYIFNDEFSAQLELILEDQTFEIRFNQEDITKLLHEFAKIPIPPYIRGGESDEQDVIQYQTVYAKSVGSVAAPTAGLHFTPMVFENMQKAGIDSAFVTLHVGMGTFLPVKSENILEHKMHFEQYSISQISLEKLNRAKKIFAVGTTSLRVLESIYNKKSHKFEATPDLVQKTNIFLHPGVPVESISGMITNFHLPKSSLIMLVSALIGRQTTLKLYQHAIDHQYRFYSYGDAMLILR